MERVRKGERLVISLALFLNGLAVFVLALWLVQLQRRIDRLSREQMEILSRMIDVAGHQEEAMNVVGKMGDVIEGVMHVVVDEDGGAPIEKMTRFPRPNLDN